MTKDSNNIFGRRLNQARLIKGLTMEDTDNRQRLRGLHRGRCLTSETYCRSSVFFIAVA